MTQDAIGKYKVTRINPDGATSFEDKVSVEEPLEIRIEYFQEAKAVSKSISITMRTPGDDFDLVIGFLYTEGIITSFEDVSAIKHCGINPEDENIQNVVKVTLKPDVKLDLEKLERHFYTNSSCGICGKASIESINTLDRNPFSKNGLLIDPKVIQFLPSRIRSVQKIFEQTGGLHASALVDAEGNILRMMEDVGRHNAVDKVVGSFVREGVTSMSNSMMMVSGRVSFEIVQKILMAGIPVIGAVGAPSSLALDLGMEYNMTIVGFVKDDSLNIYCGSERIKI